MGDVTTATLFPYFFVQRLSSALDNFGLGLGPEHLGSTGDVVKGLIGKRYMPAYALFALGGGGILGYLNWELGNVFGTRPSEFGAKMLKQAHLDIAGVRDATGITAAGKRAERYTPGSEMIWEIPGLSAFDPTNLARTRGAAHTYGRARARSDTGHWQHAICRRQGHTTSPTGTNVPCMT